MAGLQGLAPTLVDWGDRARVKIHASPPPPPTIPTALERQLGWEESSRKWQPPQSLRDGAGCTAQCPEAQPLTVSGPVWELFL